MSQSAARYIGNPLFEANTNTSDSASAVTSAVSQNTSAVSGAPTYYDHDLSATARRQAFVYGSAGGGPSAFYGSTASVTGRTQMGRPRSYDHHLSMGYDRYSTNTESTTVTGSNRYLDVPGMYNNRYSMEILSRSNNSMSQMNQQQQQSGIKNHSFDSPEMTRRARYE